ncbi:hypothetical protein WFJ45_22300, partial [Salmonella enterica subsp. enterica serovar Minnesota]|uniref:hypothetical protein n=1 Tax=Salmonella enterica TaxID=28901 RepID=UPI003D29541C
REAVRFKGEGDLRKLYHAADTWETIPPPPPEPSKEERSWVTVDAPGAGYLDEEYVGVQFHGERTSSPEAQHSILTDTLANLMPH